MTVRAEESGSEASVRDLMLRSARQISVMLAVVAPLIVVVSVLTGEARLGTALRFLVVAETGFVLLAVVSRWGATEREAEWLLFAGTVLASGGVIFSPAHEVLGYKVYALLAPMTSFTFAALAPVRPWLTYLLAACISGLYWLSEYTVPGVRGIAPGAYAVLCFAIAWMGDGYARNQLWLWRDLEGTRLRALDATRQKSEFLASMSHEIRTPMTAILGFADEIEIELEPTTRNAGLRSALATIRRNGTHLLTLINGILDLSKIEAGKLEVTREPCVPLAIVSEVAGLLRAQAADKGLSLETVVTGPVPAIIASDRTRLLQILINLVGNAVKFTEQGGVHIEIGLAQADASSSELELAVVDTGPGIEPDQIAKLFESFTQVQGPEQRVHPGTGLGLALSRRFARLLGGDIELSTQPGVGSRFRLHLPLGSDYGMRMLTAAEASELVAAEAASAAAAAAGSAISRLSGRVLLVEDGPDNQRLIAAILRRAGLAVEVAADGEQGCAAAFAAEAEGEPFDVILMDMLMPVLDGYGAVRRLRAAGYTRPIIALTANAMAGDRTRSMAAGCDDHLTKPIARDELLRRIGALLAKPDAR